MGNNNEYQIIRNETPDGQLQGFSIWAKTEPITVLIHTDSAYLHYHTYRGWTSFGVNNPTLQATAFESEQACLDYIQQEGLLKEGTHEWHRQTLLRVFLNHYDNARMLKAYPIFSNFADMTEVEADGVYVYLNFLEEEHRQIIEGFNGRVEP